MAKARLDVAALVPEIRLIQDAELLWMVERVWQRLWDESAFERLEDVPVSPDTPYPNIRHIQAYVKTAIAVARIYEEVHGTAYNYDHLIAGALLADISKLVEHAPSGDGYVKTEIGRLLPHASYAGHVALELGAPLEVAHIIMTHSPNAGTAPLTPEAQLFAWLDQADIVGFGYDIWHRKVVHYQ